MCVCSEEKQVVRGIMGGDHVVSGSCEVVFGRFFNC